LDKGIIWNGRGVLKGSGNSKSNLIGCAAGQMLCHGMPPSGYTYVRIGLAGAGREAAVGRIFTLFGLLCKARADPGFAF
jgi:hypothetical protein